MLITDQKIEQSKEIKNLSDLFYNTARINALTRDLSFANEFQDKIESVIVNKSVVQGAVQFDVKVSPGDSKAKEQLERALTGLQSWHRAEPKPLTTANQEESFNLTVEVYERTIALAALGASKSKKDQKRIDSAKANLISKYEKLSEFRTRIQNELHQSIDDRRYNILLGKKEEQIIKEASLILTPALPHYPLGIESGLKYVKKC